jgi:predicted secreted protein
MKTITGREIEVKANETDLTFDITVDGDTTYRTIEMSQEEFDSNEFNTANDWQQFLKGSDYYKI